MVCGPGQVEGSTDRGSVFSGYPTLSGLASSVIVGKGACVTVLY